MSRKRQAAAPSTAFWYLGQPYGSKSYAERSLRALAAVHASAALMSKGVWVYSPIAHMHEASRLMPVWTHRQWLDYDLEFLRVSKGLLILPLPGWRQSHGLAEEIEKAREWGKTIYWLECPNSSFFGIEKASPEVLAELGASVRKFRIIRRAS